MELIRGDSKPLRFKRTSKKDGEVITDLPDQLYFTVKYAYESKNPIFQKVLNKDIKFNEEDNFYYFMINPEDTDNYPYRDYVYDIEVITKGFKQTIAIGELKLTEEVTHACNEHYENADEIIDIEDLTVEEIVTMEEYTPTYENTGTKNYEELENKPAIDGNELHAQTTSEELGLATTSYVDGKIPTIPTNVSAFTNDAGYLTEHQDISDLASKEFVNEKITGALEASY